MNIKLIKKYQIEFNYWINGGKLICLLDNPDENWFEILSNSQVFESTYPFPIKHIIKNDEYVELRKAGVEGKQLQVSYNGGKNWYDKQYNKVAWTAIQMVRVKPEYTQEPEYEIKIGDFVRVKPFNFTDSSKNNTVIKRVKNISFVKNTVSAYVFDDETCAFANDVKPWIPTEKDLCWYRVSKWSNKEESILRYWSRETDIYDLVEPYIKGKLPTWIKGEL